MAKRTDSNQSEIVNALRDAKFEVHDLSANGKSLPDLLVKGWDGWVLIEIKTAETPISREQMAFLSQTKGLVGIARTIDEAADIARHPSLYALKQSEKDSITQFLLTFSGKSMKIGKFFKNVLGR